MCSDFLIIFFNICYLCGIRKHKFPIVWSDISFWHVPVSIVSADEQILVRIPWKYGNLCPCLSQHCSPVSAGCWETKSNLRVRGERRRCGGSLDEERSGDSVLGGEEVQLHHHQEAAPPHHLWDVPERHGGVRLLSRQKQEHHEPSCQT